MKTLLPVVALVLAAGLLAGCPDTKIPKTPPKIPEPKAGTLIPTGLAEGHSGKFPSQVRAG